MGIEFSNAGAGIQVTNTKYNLSTIVVLGKHPSVESGIPAHVLNSLLGQLGDAVR